MTHEETLYKMLADMSGSIGRIEGSMIEVKTNQVEFRASLLHLFEMHHACTGPHAAEMIEDLRSEFDKHLERTTTTKTKSDDKISRPPAAKSQISDRTIQLLIVLAVVALGGAGILVQVLGV